MKYFLISLTLLMLVGCTPESQETITDQCLRSKLFKECMTLIPKGPSTVHENGDWEGVIDECGSQAYWQAQRKRMYIKPECQS